MHMTDMRFLLSSPQFFFRRVGDACIQNKLQKSKRILNRINCLGKDCQCIYGQIQAL